MAKWYVARNGAEEGPFDDTQLRKLALQGVLSPADIVRRDGSTTGSPAKKVKGLFTLPTSVEKKRPPPPPSRLGVGRVGQASTAVSPAVVRPPHQAPQNPAALVPPQNTFYPTLPTASSERTEQRRQHRRLKTVFVVGSLFALACAATYFTYRWDQRKQVAHALRTGDELWQQGDKVGAVTEYRKVLDVVSDQEVKATLSKRIAEVEPIPTPQPASGGSKPEKSDGLSPDFLPVLVGKTKFYRDENFGLGGRIDFLVLSEETGQPDGSLKIKTISSSPAVPDVPDDTHESVIPARIAKDTGTLIQAGAQPGDSWNEIRFVRFDDDGSRSGKKHGRRAVLERTTLQTDGTGVQFRGRTEWVLEEHVGLIRQRTWYMRLSSKDEELVSEKRLLSIADVGGEPIPIASADEDAESKPETERAGEDGGTGGEPIVRVVTKPSFILSLKFSMEDLRLSANGTYLLVNHHDLWHLPSRRQIAVVLSGDFSPDGRFIAAHGPVERINVTEAEFKEDQRLSREGKERITLYELRDETVNAVTSMVVTKVRRSSKWSGDSRYLAIAPSQDKAELIDWRSTPPKVTTYAEPAADPEKRYAKGSDSSFELSPDGHVFVVAWKGGHQLAAYETASGKLLRTVDLGGEWKLHGAQRCTVRGFSPKGRFLVTEEEADIGSERWRLWNTTSWENVATVRHGKGTEGPRMPCIMFLDDESKFADYGSDATEQIIRSTSDGSVVGRRPFAASRRFFPSGFVGHEWRIVDWPEGVIEVWHDPESAPTAMLRTTPAVKRDRWSISTDGRYVACGVREPQTVEIWDLTLGKTMSLSAYRAYRPSDTPKKVPVYFVLTAEEEREGWRIPGSESNPPAPPVTKATFDRLRVGMLAYDAKKILGGCPHKSKTKSWAEEDTSGGLIRGTVSAQRTVEVYSGAKPGSVVVLEFLQDTDNRREKLIDKTQKGLD
jgi:WD40 repeat protein